MEFHTGRVQPMIMGFMKGVDTAHPKCTNVAHKNLNFPKMHIFTDQYANQAVEKLVVMFVGMHILASVFHNIMIFFTQ